MLPVMGRHQCLKALVGAGADHTVGWVNRVNNRLARLPQINPLPANTHAHTLLTRLSIYNPL